jgi:hypothetical protein
LAADAYMAAVEDVVEELVGWFRARGMRHLESSDGGWGAAHRMRFKVSQHPTSFNLPLHRALGQLLAHGLACRETVGGGGGRVGGGVGAPGGAPLRLGRIVSLLRARRGFARCLLEHPLRTQALSVQVECLMWVRNGFSLRTQSSIYSMQRYRSRDQDMLVLQVALALRLPCLSACATVCCTGGAAGAAGETRRGCLLWAVCIDSWACGAR